MMMVDDLGGGVQKRPFCDDVICEQPLTLLGALAELVRAFSSFSMPI